MLRTPVLILGLATALAAAGCFYPPQTQPPPDAQQQVIIPLPYDLGWDAVTRVIAQNQLHVQAQDMTNGIIEAAGPRFTLRDADCGRVKAAAGSYQAEPELNSSSVYNFLVRPRGPEATLVEVRATFNSSVKVPFRQATDVDCVSHGTQESDLLREVLVAAKETHRPTYSNSQSSAPSSPQTAEQPPEASVEKPGAPPPQPGASPDNRPPEVKLSPNMRGFSLGGSSSMSNLPGGSP